MSEVHGALAIVVAIAGIGAIVAAIALRLGRQEGRLWLDRAILVVLAVAAVDALIGLGLVALGHAPTDLLHVVYAAAAVVALPAARWAGRSGDLRRRAVWVAAGSAVLLGVLVRLAQTG